MADKTAKNPLGSGRKKLPADKKMTRCSGGMVSPETLAWIKTNGWNEVRKAIDFYRSKYN